MKEVITNRTMIVIIAIAALLCATACVITFVVTGHSDQLMKIAAGTAILIPPLWCVRYG